MFSNNNNITDKGKNQHTPRATSPHLLYTNHVQKIKLNAFNSRHAFKFFSADFNNVFYMAVNYALTETNLDKLIFYGIVVANIYGF